MGSMLGQIKAIVELRDAILYDHIHKHVVKRWDNMSFPLHALAYVLTQKYYTPCWLAQTTPRSGIRRKKQIDLEIQSEYMLALEKLICYGYKL